VNITMVFVNLVGLMGIILLILTPIQTWKMFRDRDFSVLPIIMFVLGIAFFIGWITVEI